MFVIYIFHFGLSLVNTMSRLAKVIVCQIVKIPKKLRRIVQWVSNIEFKAEGTEKVEPPEFLIIGLCD